MHGFFCLLFPYLFFSISLKISENMSDYTTNASVNLNVNGKEAEETLAKLKQRASDYRDAIAKAAKEGNKTELKRLRKELKATEREIKSIQSATVNVADVLKRLDSATPKELKSTLKQLTKELKNMERGTKTWNEQAEKIRRVKKELDSVNQSLKEQQTGWQKMSGWLNKWQTMAVAAFAVVMKVVSSARQAVNAYAEMEQEMANVRKFTGMTMEQVEDLNEEFKNMNTRTSREDLNKLAQEAGRLGKTSKEDVLGFVRAADQINVALDDLGEGATLTLSKLTGIFGDEERLGTEKSLLAVGSVINELSQNCSASAPYLAEFTSRMGGVGSQAGMTIQQIMGFAAVLDSNNQKVEASATALSQVIVRLYQDPAKYAKPAGLEVQSFTKLLREDANAAIILLLESLNKMGNMDVLSPIFAEMGENGSRAIDALSTLAGNIEEVKKQQEVANVAFSEATSVGKEFDVQNNTVQAGLDKAKKKFNELAADLGQKLLPVMKYAISSSSAIVHILSTVVTWCFNLKGILIPLVSAIAAYWVATKLAVVWSTALNTVTKAGALIQSTWAYAVGLSKVAVLALSGQFKAAKTALTALNATMKASPWGLVAAAVVAVGVAIYQLASKTDEYKQSLDDAMKKANGFTSECIKEETELDKLFGKLEGTTKGTKDYNDAKNTIIKNYGQYLQGLINERGEITNLELAYNRLTIAIRQNAKAKGIAAAREALDTAYFGGVQDQLEKLRTTLIEFGADARQAERIVSATAEQIATGKAIPSEIQTELSQIQNQFSWSHLTPSQTPVGIFNSITANMADYSNRIRNLDNMENAVRPAKNANNLTLRAAITMLERIVNGSEDGGTVSVIQVDGSMTSQFMSKEDAEELLALYIWEQTQRGSSGDSSGDGTGETPPLYPTNDMPPTSNDKFSEEKTWKEREEALNRISYATGQKSYEDYRKRIDEIAVEYYKKLMNHTEASADEQLQYKAQYYDALQKQQETNNAISLESENARHLELVATEKQRYINGQTSLEAYNNAIAIYELEHKRRIVQIYQEGTQERLDAERDYQNALFQDMQRRQKEMLQKIADFQKKYMQLSVAERMKVEFVALKALYDQGLIKEEEYQKAKAAIANEYLGKMREEHATPKEKIDKAQKEKGENEDLLDTALENGLISAEEYQRRMAKLTADMHRTIADGLKNTGNEWITMFANVYESFTDFIASLKGDSTGMLENLSKLVGATSAVVIAGLQVSSQFAQAEADIQIAALEKRYDKEISLAEGNSYKVKKLEKQKEKETAKIKNEANKKQFAAQVVQAIAQSITAGLNAYASTLAIPVVGPALAPAAMALAVATGMMQVALLKKQQQASEAQGYASGGFTPKGGKYEPAGIVHKGEWVASQDLLASPVARPMIEALDYAQRTNTIGSLKADDVSRSFSAPAIIASSNDGNAMSESLAAQAVALAGYASVMRRLNERLDEPFVTVNTVTGDTGIKKAQDDYDKLIRNKTPKSKR